MSYHRPDGHPHIFGDPSKAPDVFGVHRNWPGDSPEDMPGRVSGDYVVAIINGATITGQLVGHLSERRVRTHNGMLLNVDVIL